MGIFKRKSERERLSDSLGELRDGLTKSRLLKAGLIAGGLAGRCLIAPAAQRRS